MPRRSQFDFNDVEGDALLLVEGIDDARFFNAFLRRGLNKSNVQIAQVRGKDNFRPFIINTLARADGLHNLRRLGIVRDGDNSASSAFQSLRDALTNAHFPAPLNPWQTVQSENLSVSVAILPDGIAQGDLEDLCLRSIANPLVRVCVDQYIEFVSGIGLPSRQLSKSRLHTFLAAGNEPGRRLGEAADAGVWDWSSPAFSRIADFLRNL